MEDSWREQRLWGIASAIEALGDHPVASEINAQLQPPNGLVHAQYTALPY